MHKIQKKFLVLKILVFLIFMGANQANESKEQAKQEIEMLELQIKKAKLQEQLRLLNEQQLEGKKEKVDTNTQSLPEKKIEKEVKNTNTPQESNIQEKLGAVIKKEVNITNFTGFEVGIKSKEEYFLAFNLGLINALSPYHGGRAYLQASYNTFSTQETTTTTASHYITSSTQGTTSFTSTTKTTTHNNVDSFKLTANTEFLFGYFGKTVGGEGILGLGLGGAYVQWVSSKQSTSSISMNNYSTTTHYSDIALTTHASAGFRLHFANHIALDIIYRYFLSFGFANAILMGEQVFSGSISLLF